MGSLIILLDFTHYSLISFGFPHMDLFLPPCVLRLPRDGELVTLHVPAR